MRFFLALLAPVLAIASEPVQDPFWRLGQINKASIVMLAEKGIVPRPLASEIARGIERVVKDESAPGAKRSSDYLQFEALLMKAAGPDASRLHTGRSRQDIGSTSARMQVRSALFDVFEASLAPRQNLLDLAEKHVNTVIPAYTHGVQAQPISLGHYLAAFAAAMERDAERMQQLFPRLDQSPLGAAALATSGFALDRKRLAELLGFGRVAENSLDANQVAAIDIHAELGSILAISALHVGQFVQDLHTQYHDPAPWMQLHPSLTGSSSIMPQKRNPSPLEALRIVASSVVGEAQVQFFIAHNVPTGMNDNKQATQVLEAVGKARQMYEQYGRLVNGIEVDAKRSLAEVDADYSTMTEVADALMRHGDVPFRIGHHYASDLTTYGRKIGKRPKDLSEQELVQVYEESTKGQKMPGVASVIRAALNAEDVVRNRRGLGGTQPDEVLRMIAERRKSLEASRGWLKERRSHIERSEQALEDAFSKLAGARE